MGRNAVWGSGRRWRQRGGRDGLINALPGRRSPKGVRKGYDKAAIQWLDDALSGEKEVGRGLGLSYLCPRALSDVR